MYGLKEQSGGAAAEALRLALAPKIRASHAPLDAQGIGNALYGLKEQSGSAATEAVLLSLAPKIRASQAQLGSQAV
eukprot:gene10600-gene584